MRIRKKDNDEVRSLSRGEPERHFLSLREAINRLFDESFLDPFESRIFSVSPIFSKSFVFPRVDISETAKEVKVVADIPGVDPDRIEIDVDEDSLVLSGNVSKEEEDKGARYYRYEREYGEFRREIALPSRVKPDKVKAKAKNGVLTIVMPKAEEEKRKRIRVESS